MQGYVQIYTGNGKGKTTAALGLTLRAAGAGLKVFIGQFLKNGDYSEIRSLQSFSDFVTVKQYGTGNFVFGSPSEEDRSSARKGFEELRDAVFSNNFDIVIMEEINTAIKLDLVTVEEVLALLREKPEKVEVVLTGRGAHPDLIEAADLVTEMKEIKHYFAKGVNARLGIEK